MRRVDIEEIMELIEFINDAQHDHTDFYGIHWPSVVKDVASYLQRNGFTKSVLREPAPPRG